MYDGVKELNEQLLVKVSDYTTRELAFRAQEAASAAQLNALAVEAAAQLEDVNRQRIASEANAAAAAAKVSDLQKQLILMEERLRQQQQEQQQLEQQRSPQASPIQISKHSPSCSSTSDTPVSYTPQQLFIESSGPPFDTMHVSGVGSRWSLMMKEQVRQQQQKKQDQLQRPEALERTLPPSPSTAEHLAAAAATVKRHNEHIQLMQNEAESLRQQLISMQTRAETSEFQLQKMRSSTSPSESALSAAAANFSRQRLSPSPAEVAAADDAAAHGSNLLQLSQLTAQVVLDCRRMTEVNNEQLQRMQVALPGHLCTHAIMLLGNDVLSGTGAVSSPPTR
jgi:hypothetical protein